MSDAAPVLETRTLTIDINGRAYEALFERGDHNWSASVVVDGIVVATGRTLEDTIAELRDALVFHLAGVARDRHERPWFYGGPTQETQEAQRE